MAPAPKPSFSPYRKWGIGLQVCLFVMVVLSVVVMINYISQAYFARMHLSAHSKAPLSPRTVQFLQSLTNQVKVTIYYDKDDPLYDAVSDLLKEYKLVTPKISLQMVDYKRDPVAALELKKKYSFLAAPGARNLVIFDSLGVFPVPGEELARYAIEQVPDPESPFRRKLVAFAGEKWFTSALLAVTSPKPLKACFLQGDGEHDISGRDPDSGYDQFAAVLNQNYVKVQPLSLLGTNAVPDCNLLVIAGPTEPLPAEALGKIDQYLSEGGRLLVLFDYRSLRRATGLEPLLAKWGVGVDSDIVRDPENTTQHDASDMKVFTFTNHPVVEPLQLSGLHLVSPRSIRALPSVRTAAQSLQVRELAFSGPKARADGDVARGQASFPLMVAVEKAAIKGVITERGATRILVAGDSFFLDNRMIESAANREFAGLVVNWLLDRTQLLADIGARPMPEYRLVITRTQMQTAQFLLLGGFPGSALLLGALVWLRRRA